MLKTHLRFLANMSINAARRTELEINRAINSLSFLPERFPFFDAEAIPDRKYRKMYVDKWYLILYQIKDDTVYIDYILDCRQEYPWIAE